MAKTCELEFKEYCLDKSRIPNITGIYCVYTCTHGSGAKEFNIHKLIYIGQSTNIH